MNKFVGGSVLKTCFILLLLISQQAKAIDLCDALENKFKKPYTLSCVENEELKLFVIVPKFKRDPAECQKSMVSLDMTVTKETSSYIQKLKNKFWSWYNKNKVENKVTMTRTLHLWDLFSNTFHTEAYGDKEKDIFKGQWSNLTGVEDFTGLVEGAVFEGDYEGPEKADKVHAKLELVSVSADKVEIRYSKVGNKFKVEGTHTLDISSGKMVTKTKYNGDGKKVKDINCTSSGV